MLLAAVEKFAVSIVYHMRTLSMCCSFELSVSKMNEMYPCPSIYSFATDEARFLNTQCINYIICHGDTMQTFKQVSVLLVNIIEEDLCRRLMEIQFILLNAVGLIYISNKLVFNQSVSVVFLSNR